MFQNEPNPKKHALNTEEPKDTSSLRKIISTFRKLQFNSSTKDFVHNHILDLELFEEMDFGVYLIDYQSGKYAYVNNALSNLLGIRREDLLNKKMSVFSSYVHPEDFPKLMEILSKAGNILKKMQHAERALVKFRVFYRILKADGSFCWCMQSNKLIDDLANESQIDLGTIVCLPDHQSFERVTGFIKTDKKCIEISEIHDSIKPIGLLSARELEVITFVSKGLNSREISVKLMLSEQTIKIHRKNILKKLNVNSSIQAIRLLELG